MKRIPHRSLAWVLALCAFEVASVALPARAQGQTSGSAQASEQLPFGDLFPAEELNSNFGSHQFTPFGDSKFSFEILVPKGWDSHLSEVDPGQIAEDTKAPVPMSEFAPNSVDDVGVQVLYMRAPTATPLDRFLEDYAKNNGGTIVTRQHLEFKGRKLEDMLMRTTADDLGPLLSRVTAFQRGDLIFVFVGWGVDEKYERYKRMFGAVLASFNPTGN